MKIYPAALIAALACLVLCGCTRECDTSASDLVFSAISDCPSLNGSYTTYICGGAEGGDGYLSPADFYSLYYGKRPAQDELSLLCDWCIALSRSPDVRELHVMKSKSKSERDKIVQMLERREALLCAPELLPTENRFFGTRSDTCRVFTSGCFVILYAGDDPQEIEGFFE